MQTLLKLLLLIGVTAYLIFACFAFLTREDTMQCKNLNILIADSAQATLITAKDVDLMLRKSHLYPIGKAMKDIDLARLQQTLQKDPFIREAICVKTPGERINVMVQQRLPLLRIIADNGEDYYVDNNGFPMEARGYEADLPVVTGKVTKDFIKKHLLPLGKLLSQDEYWNNQVMQIQVQENQEIDLSLRVGTAIVHLGEANNYEKKMNNLRAFYDKVLPNVGWNRYQSISVAYENQVIGTKQTE